MMRLLDKVAVFLVPLSFLLITTICAVGWLYYPGKKGWLLAPAAYFFALIVDRINYGWINAPKPDAARQCALFCRVSVAGSAIIVSAFMMVAIAIGQELLPQTWYLDARRGAGILTSLCMILWGNHLPKLSSPWIHPDEPFDWQGVHRFAGIAFIVTGLLCFAAWSLLPLHEAKTFTQSMFLTTAVIVVARKWYSLATWRGHGTQSNGNG
jgi:hypothetical protein